jgi:hypothetical protein
MSSEKPSGGSDVYVSQEGLDEVLRGLRRRRASPRSRSPTRPASPPPPSPGSRRATGARACRCSASSRRCSARPPRTSSRRPNGSPNGAKLDTVLDDLPEFTAWSASSAPLEIAGDYGPVASRCRGPTAMPRSPFADLDLSGRGCRRWRWRTCSRVEDRDGAVALLRDAIEWLAERGGSSTDVARLREELREVLRGPEQGREPVAAMPTGEVRYVFKHALAGTSGAGLDRPDGPGAHRRPRPRGPAGGALRRRRDRGRPRTPGGPGFGPREDRHRVKVTVEGDAGSSVPEPDPPSSSRSTRRR